MARLVALSPRGASGERDGERGCKNRAIDHRISPLPDPLPTPSGRGKYLRLALVLVSRCAQRVAHLWHCHPIESGLQDLHSPCTSSSDGERVVPTAAGVKGVRHITLVVVPRCVWVWWSVVCSPVRRAEWPQR